MKLNLKRIVSYGLPVIVLIILCYSSSIAFTDYYPTEGWRTSTPESQGMNSDLLEKMMDIIWEKDLDIDSVLVVRNGRIVLDAYKYPRKLDVKHNIYSCTKSIMSVLVGIAIDKGYIKGVNLAVLDFFPELVAKNLDSNKKSMTLEHLLTMTTGLECRDSYIYNWDGLRDMNLYNDWTQYMLDLPMVEPPGVNFEYCNGASFLLSAILQEQTDMNALKFANEYLFGPLGISDVSWPTNSQEITIGYGELHMRPHDMAKIGYLYLNDGYWDGQQIISPEWIETSTRKHIAATFPPGYGYQWWVIDSKLYTAIGHQGQFIIIAPDKNLVSVFTSRLYSEDTFIPVNLFMTYITSAIQAPISLSENPKGKEALKSKVARWQTTSSVERRKINRKVKKASPSPEKKEYINTEYGFSAEYDAELSIVDSQLMTPVVFRVRSIRGVPIFAALVDDIPQGMKLKNSGKYMIDLYKSVPQITDPKIKKQELITLSDGTEANYIEINWKFQSISGITVCILAYKHNKILATTAGSMGEAQIEKLASMAKSLKITK